jgi:disulfide bond formation protein DsbB
MSRNNRNKLFNSIQLNYLNLLVVGSVLAFSSYLEYVSPMPMCSFCVAIRLILVLLMGLSLGVLFIPAHRRIIYPAQLLSSIIGLALSLRQVYFEQVANRFTACPKQLSNGLKTVFNWLYAGAPACQKTPLLGPMTLASWLCIVFAILCIIAVQLYLRHVNRR